ncbi:MAG TPA: signal peptidase I [Bacillota bacterium]|nr:signal peptidase I [Bacillota bacterium]
MNTSDHTKKTRDKAVTAIGIILCILLIPMLIINITLIVKSFVYPNEVPSFLGYKPFIVLSGSMEPEFYSGDLVLVKEVAVDTLKVGDVISYREGNSVTTHRILEITESTEGRKFITKGDNNNVSDRNPVSENMVEGQYLFHLSKLGNFAIFMQTPIGMIIFIACPLALFILYDVFRRILFDRKKNKKTQELEAELEKMRQQLAEKQDSNANKPQE